MFCNFSPTSTCCATTTGSISQAIFSDTVVTRFVSQATTFLISSHLHTPAHARFTTNPVHTFQLPSFPDSLLVPPLLPAGNPEGSVCPGFRCFTVSLPLVHASRAYLLFL